jgi:hypothetical protein
MELFGLDLREHGNDEDGGEDGRADGVAQVHLHGDRVAAGFAESGAENLDDPERNSDRGDFA